MRLANGRRVCDTVRNLWPHPEVFANCEAIAESGVNRGNPPRSHCRTVLRTNYFQMEIARMMSEKRTFAALESFSVPITMRIAQDSNWA